MRVPNARAPRLGIVLWFTAVLLAALEVPSLNSPETTPAPRPRVSVTP
jgi:hypothetical protein